MRVYHTGGVELAAWRDVFDDAELTVELAFTSHGGLVSLDVAGTLRAWPAAVGAGGGDVSRPDQ